jgi:hypothetical protein
MRIMRGWKLLFKKRQNHFEKVFNIFSELKSLTLKTNSNHFSYAKLLILINLKICYKKNWRLFIRSGYMLKILKSTTCEMKK